MSPSPGTIGKPTALTLWCVFLSAPLLVPTQQGYAQPKTLYFELVSEEIPANYWFDRQGFAWIQLENDVFLYDGTDFLSIEHIWPEFAEITHRMPNMSIVDPQGLIWIGLGNDVARSLGLHGSLELLDLFPDDSSETILYSMLLDCESTIWIGTSKGLVHYDPSGTGFTRYRHQVSNPESISDDAVTSLAQDSSGSIWAGTMNGLNRLKSARSGQFIRYSHKAPIDTAGAYLGASVFPYLYVDRQGDLWGAHIEYATDNWTINAYSGSLVRYDSSTDSVTSVWSELDRDVTGFAQDRSGVYWTATMGGLYTFDSNRKNLLLVDTRTREGRHLEVNRGRLVVDHHDILWLSTREGLAKTDLRRQNFERYGHDPSDPKGLHGYWVDRVVLNDDSTAWVASGNPGGGREDEGLSLLDRSSGRYTHYLSESDGMHVPNGDIVHEIIRDRSGGLLLGTVDGLIHLDPSRGLSRRFYLGGDTLSTLPVGNSRIWTSTVHDIAHAADGDLWLGLDIRCLQSDCGPQVTGSVRGAPQDTTVVIPVRLDPDNTLHYYAKSGRSPILIDRRGSAWMVVSGGISRYDPKSDTWALFLEADSLLPGVPHMYADVSGDIWIATWGDGLWRFNPDEKTLENYKWGETRNARSLACIVEDDLGFLWISSFDGLVRFRKEDGAVDRFTIEDGLQGRLFAGAACDRTESGELAFGGNNGLNIFRPRETVVNPYPPEVVVTEVRIDDRILAAKVDRLPSNSRASTGSEILASGNNNIAIEYTAIHFSRPKEITFEYRLEGFDTGWQNVGTQRQANFTNLDPGEYTFSVRAFNGTVRSELDARLFFVILTPWWMSWWAYTFYLVAFAGVLYAGYSFRVRRLKARSRKLEREVAERTRELQEQAERLVELDVAKNRFFANISHEFRTPMTLILGPLQDLLDGVHGRFSRDAREQLGTMRRSADRMLALITQLLDLTRMDAGQLEVRRLEVDVIDHLQALVQSFVPMAERGGVTLEVVPEADELNFYSDPDMLDKVVGNLLSNAIKFTPQRGNVWVTSRLRGDESVPTLEILVKDTGPGIPKHELAHIFDRFASFDPASGKATSWARSHEGIGIGLALARELVELHDGTILVESVPGFGSTFTVRLPYEPVVARLHETDEGTEETHADISGEGDGLGHVETGRASILVVDDNADVRAYIRTHLCGQYRVIEAANGEEGLEAVRAEEPDLVLTDVMMPVMDGYALCRELKSDEKLRDIPVVMLTAKAGEESTLEGLESGADEYIPKPFSMPEMKARVANLIEARRHMRNRFSREVVVQPAGITIESEDEAFLNRVLEAIDAHLGDSNFSVDWLADELGMSNRHLRRRVEAVTGEPPAELIRRIRLERASQLLEGHAGTVAEVAYKVGFKSVSHFSTRFNERYGVRPSQWDGKEE